MKITFTEIPDQGLRLEINDESWFPDQEITRTAPVSTRLYLEKKGAERVLMEGEIKTVISLNCDRCLESYSQQLDEEFRVDIELFFPDQEKALEEHHCSDSEMDTIFIDIPVIDVFDILTEQMFLLLPQKRLCSESCKGICHRCGENLNQADCRCRDEHSSPFAILASLKK